MNKPYFCPIFFVTYWHQKCLKNTMDLLLFYREHFLWTFGKWFMKMLEKKHSFHNKHIYVSGSQPFWSFMKFYFVDTVKICFVFKK